MNTKNYYQNIIYYSIRWIFFAFALLMHLIFLDSISNPSVETYILFLTPILLIFVFNILQYKIKKRWLLHLKVALGTIMIILSYGAMAISYEGFDPTRPEFVYTLPFLACLFVIYTTELRWFNYKPQPVFLEKEVTDEKEDDRSKKKAPIYTIVKFLMVANLVIIFIGSLAEGLIVMGNQNAIFAFVVLLVQFLIAFILSNGQFFSKVPTITLILKFLIGNFTGFLFIVYLLLGRHVADSGESFILFFTLGVSLVITIFEIVYIKQYFRAELALQENEE